MLLWLKAFHIVFMVTWFAGLFYLPRLFVYHALSDDRLSRGRFKVMERKLYFGIMTPGALLTVASGVWLWLASGAGGGWLQVKLLLVAALAVYHVACGKYLRDFKHERNRRGHVFFRWFNEAPVVFLVAIAALTVVKPF